MAFTAPRTWVAGELITASIGNIHWRDNLIALRAGEIALGSQAALDDVYASSATQFARVASGSRYQVRRLNNAQTAYERSSPHWLRGFDDTGAATGANTTETVLYTFSANSNLLHVNGRTLRIVARGTVGNNENNKTIRVRWGGIGGTIVAELVTDTASFTLTGYTQWWLEAWVTRSALNVQRLSGRGWLSNASSGQLPFLQQTLTTATQTETGVITLVVTGQNGTAAAGDITYMSGWVEQLGETS